MSSGSFDLLFLAAKSVEAFDRPLSVCCVIGGIIFSLFLSSRPFGPSPLRMRQSPEGSRKTDSMQYSRVGFGVKYLGFQHIDLCIFLFIFLRGVLT
ncbi:hypothetical protein BHE74_00011359 [Ensete ventricosum]|nr:hypothetical protein BHE74_00011359 [Ensete ventricosum]